MSKIVTTTSYDFDDLHIITEKIGIVSSRNNIKFNNNKIIVAPMSAIQNAHFNHECIQNGLSLPVHRFNSPQEQFKLMEDAVSAIDLYNSQSRLWLSVGLKDWKERFDLCKKLLSTRPFELMLDVAYCYTEDCIEEIKKIKQYTSMNVASGNVHTGAAFHKMKQYSNMLRCGIGAGEACLTTPNTGIGRGQLSVVLDCRSWTMEDGLISDGGIRKPGDVAKAFGAGANYVMIGGMFKEAVESEAFKTGVFYGGASSHAKSLVGNDNRYIEGKSIRVGTTTNEATTVKSIADSISDGVKSCVSYCGYDDIEDFIGNALFEVKK